MGCRAVLFACGWCDGRVGWEDLLSGGQGWEEDAGGHPPGAPTASPLAETVARPLDDGHAGRAPPGLAGKMARIRASREAEAPVIDAHLAAQHEQAYQEPPDLQWHLPSQLGALPC